MDDEVYDLDDQGRPIPRFYSRLQNGMVVEDQERGTLVRTPNGFQEAMRTEERRSVMDRITGRDDPAARNMDTWVDKAGAAAGSATAAAKEFGGNVLTGAAKLFSREDAAEDSLLGTLGEDLRKSARHDVPANPQAQQDFLTGGLPRGLAQMGITMATAGLAGPVAATGLNVSQQAGAGYTEAKQYGATEEEATLSALLNAPVGAIEMLPVNRMFSRLNKATGGTTSKAIMQRLTSPIKGGVTEAVQEGIQTTVSNKIAMEIYDENRELFDSVGVSMKEGGAVGAIADAMLNLMGATRAGFRAARNQPSPEVVDAEYIPPPDEVDAVWLSDETAMSTREAGMSGPARSRPAPGVPPSRQIERAGLPAPADPQGLPQPDQPLAIEQTRFPVQLDTDAPADTTLTASEQDQLPVNQVASRQNREAAEWREQVDRPRNEAATKLERRAARLPMRENDHPVAQLRNWIRESGGIIYDESIEPDLWDKVPAAYRNDPNAKQRAPKMKRVEREDGTVEYVEPKTGRNRKRNGVRWEDLVAEINQLVGDGGSLGVGIDVDTTDPTQLLELLTGPKTNPDGTPRFPPSWYEEEMQNLSRFYTPELSEDQMRKTPVGEVLRQFDPESPTLDNFMVRPDDLTPGDIVRVEDELYQVQEQGNVKVLRDGTTVPLDPESEYIVNGVVKPDSPVYTQLRDVYNRIESMADTSAPDPDAMPVNPDPTAENELLGREQVRAELEGEVQDAELNPVLPAGFSLEAQTPADVDAERAAAESRQARAKAEERMAAPLTGTTGDMGQARLFNDEAQPGLFEGPSAEDQAARRSEPTTPPASEDRKTASRRRAWSATAMANVEPEGLGPYVDPFGVDMQRNLSNHGDVNQDGAPGDKPPADSRLSPEQVNAELASFYEDKLSNPPDLPKWAKDAWEAGRKTSDLTYEQIMAEDLAPSWIWNDYESSVFFEAGRRGESPEYVVGFRYGDLPENGRSRNHASNEAEAGISTAYVHGRTDQELNALTMVGVRNRNVVHVEGWAFPESEWGSDGEIVLHVANILTEAPKGNSFESSTPLTGTTGDMGQARLFNDESQPGLFEGPTAQDQNAAREPAAEYNLAPVEPSDVVSYLENVDVRQNQDQIAREQLDLFNQIRQVDPVSYRQRGRGDASEGSESAARGAGQAEAVSAAWLNPEDPELWKRVQMRPGKPASVILHERFKGERTAWPVTGVKVEGPQDAMALAMMLRSPYQESSKLLALDNEGRVVESRVFALGLLNASLMHPREAFGNLSEKSTQIILLHNHPSGNVTPSPEDLKVSRDFVAAAEQMGLRVIDHVITDDWKGLSLAGSELVTFPESTRIPYSKQQDVTRADLRADSEVERLTRDEPDLPEWSALARDKLPTVSGPKEVQKFLVGLRQGNPSTGHVVYLGSRNQIVAVMPVDFEQKTWRKDISRGAADVRAKSMIVSLPEHSSTHSATKLGRELVDMGKKIKTDVLDVIGSSSGGVGFTGSLRESGMVAFELFEAPQNPYQAARQMREQGLLPDDMEPGEAAGFVVQESLSDYIAGKQHGARKFMENIGPKANGPELKGDYRSADPEVEERLTRNEAAQKNPWWKVSPEKVREMARSFTRAYPEIRDTDGAIIYLLESTAHVSGAAEAISKGHLADVVGRLGMNQYKLFSRLLVGRDVARSIEDGLYVDKEIPFGWQDLDAVRADLSKWEADAARNPEITRALERRSRFMQSLRDDLVEAGLLPEAVQDIDDYFHRLVTEYMEATNNAPGGQARGVEETTAGFQRRRTGGGDFITDYLTAEHDVVSHAIAQLRFKEIRDQLQRLTDKAPEVKQVARQRNLEAVHGGAENYRKVRETLERYNMSGEDSQTRAKMLESIADIDVLRPYRAMKAQAVSRWEQATGQAIGGNPNQVMNEAIQGKHGEAANWAAAQWFKAISEEEGFIRDQLGGEYLKWKGGVDKRLIPAGHVAWRPKSGHRMFKAMSVSEAVIEGILDGQRELLPTDVKEVLVSAGLYPEWIVPENVAQALNRMSRDKAMNGFDAGLQRVTKHWKSYKLMAPWHTPKYYFNNFTGDLDFALALDPGILKYVRQAVNESTDINLRRKRLNREQEFLALQGVIGGQVRGEIGHIRKDELFSIVTGEKPHLVQRYMNKLGPLQKQREDILRIAAYRYYTDQINAGKRPVGVSNPKQLQDLYEREMYKEAAAMLAKQALIDYDNPSVFGQFVKDRAIPFYRWREGNAIRYTRLIRSIFRQDAGYRDRAKRVGPVMAGKAGAIVAKRGAQLFLLAALRSAWNHIFFPEEENLLEEAGRPGQLILSKAGKDGVFDTVRIEGSITSFLGTIGLGDIDEIRAADNPVEQIGRNLVNDWTQGVSPFAKTSFEAAMGYQTWPDIFNPRPVNDRMEHMLKIWSADSLYRKITDMPMRPGRQNWINPKSWLVFTTDAGDAAYWGIRNRAMEWKRENTDNNWRPGKPTERDVYLKFFRQAHQYNQPEAAEKWLNKYLDEGGTLRKVYKSLDNQHPLIGLSKSERLQFLSSLTDQQMDLYQTAIKHFQNNIQSGSVDRELIMEIMQRRQTR